MCNLDYAYITLPGECNRGELILGWFDNNDGNCEYAPDLN